MAADGGAVVLPGGSLIASGVRAYFAPVDRADMLPVPFDPASMGQFSLDAPPPGWWSAGSLAEMRRSPGSVITPVLSGAPATVKSQGRATVEETVEVVFPAWTRLSMALSSGVQAMNLLLPAAGANAAATGGAAVVAEALMAGSTATQLQLATGTGVRAGDVIAVDVDYTGQTGYLGSAAPGAYVAAVPAVMDVDLVRRISFNVARVVAVSAGVVTLAAPLPAGAPSAAMKVSRCNGFVEREGGAFLPEWSGLFVWDGVQGDRLLLHYPRLQPAGASSAEVSDAIAGGLKRWRPSATLRALPVTDPADGAACVCFRSYLPAPMRLV